MINLPFSFLISTSRGIFSYKDSVIDKIYNGGVCFGLCKLIDQYVVLNRNNYDGTGGGNPNGVNSLEFFDTSLKYLGGIGLEFIKDGHQLYADENNDLYITNTGLNIITRISQDGKILNFLPNPESGSDVHHYNSINKDKDRWLITQHRSKSGQDDGGVTIFDKDWNKINYKVVGKHVHNCVVHDGFLWVTKSYDGELVRNNFDSPMPGTSTYSIAPGYLTRGLIFKDSYLLVGLSEFDTRDNRHGAKTGRIKVFKYPEIEYLDTIEIPDCGQINDLLLIENYEK